MHRHAWSQLRFRAGRALALLAGMLVATTAFTVLTAAARTAQLHITGTVSAHYRPAYDILVRPSGARSSLESATGTVQPDFLSGIYGGITMAQYHQIEQLAGVQVAAPIAMVGYDLADADFPVQIPAADLARPGRQLYRATTTYVSANGTTRIPDGSTYVYVTPDRLTQDGSEVLPDGSTVSPCPDTGPTTNPFSSDGSWCWSKVNGTGSENTLTSPALTGPGFGVDWEFPMLIAAIDPVAEAKLDGLDHAVTSGQYLEENYGNTDLGQSLRNGAGFPVLASSASDISERSVTTLQELPAPAGPPALTSGTMRKDDAVTGRTVLSTTFTARQAYTYLLSQADQPGGFGTGISQYWSVGPVRYQRGTDGTLVPVTVHNPISVWKGSANSGYYGPPDAADTQYRELREHLSFLPGQPNSFPLIEPRLVGTFDQARIQAFDPLTQVPLGPYQPTVASPASQATRKTLGGDLAPTLNIAGYVTQPVQLVTTLSALPQLENKDVTNDASLRRAPISVIRVRVAGVTGPNTASFDRIKAVAEQIQASTHLTVDIVTGSSPAPTTVALPASAYGDRDRCAGDLRGRAASRAHARTAARRTATRPGVNSHG